MAESIKVGDLVMLVRGHKCGLEVALGIPFTVTAILSQIGGGWHCPRCRECDIAPHELWCAAGFRGNKDRGFPLCWLKKIDPPALDETTDETEKLHA